MTNIFCPNPGIVPHVSNPNLSGSGCNMIIVHSISSYTHTLNSMVSLSKEFFNDVPVNLIPYNLHTKSILTDIEYEHISTGIPLDDMKCKYVNGTIFCEVITSFKFSAFMLSCCNT